MDKQKDVLSRIVNSLNEKYDNANVFQGDLLTEMQMLHESYEAGRLDLEREFEALFQCLQSTKDRMIEEINRERTKKKESMQLQLKNYESACSDAEELISLSKKAMEIDNNTQFNKVALSIKDRITMAPIFRLSTVPSVTDTSCHLVADLSRETTILSKVDFLPVPCTPIINESQCDISDNTVSCQWSLPDNEDQTQEDDDKIWPSFIESFIFQYRQVCSDQGNQDVPWKNIENIKELKYTIKDLLFYVPCIQVRVQAWNKAVGGEFSPIQTLSTPAFNFKLDPEASHANLKVTGPFSVAWDPSTVKGPDTRIKSGVRPSSPAKSSKKFKPKDRFIGESYTILGDTSISDDVYFEVSPDQQCKTFSFGISSQQLSRYDQLGRTAHSWCLFVSRWIQNSFVAKHNNKIKNLSFEVPNRFGIFYSPSQELLSFFDANTRAFLYGFKQVKFPHPLVPGFSVWCGSLLIHTGLQVPTWLRTRVSVSPKGNSSSIASSD